MLNVCTTCVKCKTCHFFIYLYFCPFLLPFLGLVLKEALYENSKSEGKADRLERDRARRLDGVIFLVNALDNYVKKN